MSDYAIVMTGGKQYRVRPGDTVQIERIPGQAGDTLSLDQVLLTSVDGKVTVGTPLVEATVSAEITEQGRAKKVIAFRYKNKTRQRTKRGHRQDYTGLLIKGISKSTRRRRRGAQEG